MRIFVYVVMLCALSCAGCQSASPYQNGGYLPPQYAPQQYSNQQYMPQQAPAMPPQQPVGGRVMNAARDLAGGFARSAVGGAGFSAGRDLWNAIAR